jgi:hypothetical protein|tara:strand:- start:154 stop:492 length:339 start_codon:yes stop_codon:yes gene_type:complete
MLQKIIIERKKLGLTWDFLSEGLPIAGNSLRTAFKRGKVDQVYLNHVKAVIEKYKNAQENKQEVITKVEEILVLEDLASEVLKNHHKLLQVEIYGLWFEVESQKRVIEILKE